MCDKAAKKIHLMFKGGTVTGFADEVNLDGLTLEALTKKRVSRILPENYMLRLCFRLLRTVVNDGSKLAQWTRQWSCQWRVIINGQSDGPFSDRQQAICFEKIQIHQSGGLLEFAENGDC